MKYAIETKLRDLFKAASSLDDVKVFSVGEPVFIVQQHFPMVIIFLEQRLTSAEETGVWIYNYIGYLAAETFIQDDYEIKNRAMDVTSLLTMRDILDAATDVIEGNLSLDNIVDDTETVRNIQVGDKIYGLRQRDNNMLNRGEVNFIVETQKTRAC